MVLVKWVAPVMDLLWWCNQFQRLDFRIETIHHPPCQGKVYLHTAVTLCSLWIPRAQEDPVEENIFCCVFSIVAEVRVWSFDSYSSSRASWCHSGGCRGSHLCNSSASISCLSVLPWLMQALLWEFSKFSVLFQDQQSLLSSRILQG